MIGLLVLSLCGDGVLGQGNILWNEAVNGPLSNSYQIPTPLPSMVSGSNIVLGTTESVPVGGNWLAYDDFILLTIPDDTYVSRFHVSFDHPIAIWLGNATFDEQFGYSVNHTASELLSEWGLSPLAAGQYGVYVKNYDFHPDTSFAYYTLHFVLEPVPEPSTYALLLLGVVSVACVRRLRSRASRSP